jgi:rod shape-determining protein MreC
LVFLFLILEILSFTLFIEHTYYQKAAFINSSNIISGGLYKVNNNIAEYFSLRSTNLTLAEENAHLHSLSPDNYLKINNTIFIKNDTTYKLQYQYVSAKVINNSTNKRNNYLTLNIGRNQGITKDMGVISSKGIVGIVKDVSDNFSSVISVLHKDSKISAKVKKCGDVGSVLWNGYNYRRASLIDIPTHVPVYIGDTIITSGYSSVFPEGIVIGKIIDHRIESGNSFYTITIEFAEDFNNLSYVYVIKNFFKNEQNDLEKKTQNE